MAGLARDFRLDMGRMLKVNKIGHPNSLNPLNGFFPIPIASKFSYLRIGSRRNFVTTHTTLRRRNTGYGRPTRIDVAVLAGDFIVTCMDLMVKSNGLLGRRNSVGGKSQPHFYRYKEKCDEAYSEQPLFHLSLFLAEAPDIFHKVADLVIAERLFPGRHLLRPSNT